MAGCFIQDHRRVPMLCNAYDVYTPTNIVSTIIGPPAPPHTALSRIRRRLARCVAVTPRPLCASDVRHGQSAFPHAR
jgi:hypothetical protein